MSDDRAVLRLILDDPQRLADLVEYAGLALGLGMARSSLVTVASLPRRVEVAAYLDTLDHESADDA